MLVQTRVYVVLLTYTLLSASQLVWHTANERRKPGFFKEKFTTAQFPSLPSLRSFSSSSLPSPSFPLPPLPLLAGVRGYHPRKIFGIRDARR